MGVVLLIIIMNIFLFSTMLASSLAQPATRSLNTRVPNPCSTHTGDQCVFPFTYQGVEYLRCTYADSPTPWCATQVDDAGVVVTNRWGDCDTGSLSSCEPETISVPSCTTESGPYSNEPCVFPFRYNGITYTSCTSQDRSAAWCSTKTTLAGTHVPGFYGFCPSTCLAESQTNSCTPRTSYTVDCNTCVCGADGQPVCSTTVCTSSTTTTSTTTSTTCTPGQVSTVDCNTCVCSSLGEQVCTTNTCTTSAPASTCTTVSGPDTGSQCVFPFTFSGSTYQSCADWTYGGENTGSKWCSTKVDSQGVHVNGEGNYGFCGASCDLSVDLVQQIFGTNIRSSSRDAVQFGQNQGPR